MEKLPEKVKEVFVVYGNTDLTEGRGANYVKSVCAIATTAHRIAKGGYVQGSDCPVRAVKAYYIDNTWYAPSRIIEPSKEDIQNQKKEDAKNKLLKTLEKLDEKIDTLDLTQDEMDIIKKALLNEKQGV